MKYGSLRRELNAGMYFGEKALFDDSDRTATVS